MHEIVSLWVRAVVLRRCHHSGSRVDFKFNLQPVVGISPFNFWIVLIAPPPLQFSLFLTPPPSSYVLDPKKSCMIVCLSSVCKRTPHPLPDWLSLCSRFLDEVQQHSEENKMTSLNLGTIFGPHLLAPEVMCSEHYCPSPSNRLYFDLILYSPSCHIKSVLWAGCSHGSCCLQWNIPFHCLWLSVSPQTSFVHAHISI